MEKGTPVEVTFKDGHKEKGKVVYVRMAPPNYNAVFAVSVFLDSKKNKIGYCGTMFAAESVRPC